jgi:ABC-type multidrug transport system fused ATPase/permease subunit
MSLFDPPGAERARPRRPTSGAPLADRIRPRSLDEVVGQDHLLGSGRVLRTAIERGELHSMILWGPPGSGKTTLASLIPRFYDVDRGSVTVDGQDVRNVTLTSLRRVIGVIPQDPFLFSATVRENLAFGRPDATEEELVHAAKLAQAHEFIERLPDGYDTMVGERGITLSGGQRQRLAIARALVLDPRVLILDDATASVDAATEARIRLGLREAMRGRTTLIIAHRLSTIALADEIVVLEDGRVAQRGTHDDLLDKSAVYREIWEHGRVDAQVAEQEVA